LAKTTIEIATDKAAALFGRLDENIELIGNEYGAAIALRNGAVTVTGEEQEAARAAALCGKLLELDALGLEISKERVRTGMDLERSGRLAELIPLSTDVIAVTFRGKAVRARTAGQKRFTDTVKRNIVTLASGPAGTGKTYLAVALAAAAFKNNEIEKIILTRPALEAGEKLGFLPGDMQEKFDPYLRPLYDALADMFGESYLKLIEKSVIEIAPLAFMRGRTLSNSFIILDEAQNATEEQMKMFLTRFGTGSKVIANGDITQTDLPPRTSSGFATAIKILDGIKNIGIVKLTARDVVRHELISEIINAYDKKREK